MSNGGIGSRGRNIRLPIPRQFRVDLLGVAPIEVHHEILVITRRALQEGVFPPVCRVRVIVPVVYGLIIADLASPRVACVAQRLSNDTKT